jgi:hypothetical protein
MALHTGPLLGDALYGAQRTYKADAIALRAVWLDLRGIKQREALGLPEELAASGLITPDV